MVFYVFLGVVVVGLAVWIAQSPVTKGLRSGRGVDPGQFGTPSDHIDDIGLGVSWRSDGRGGQRESRVLSKHTRRRR
jgi:hypothetical protein